MTFDEDAKLHNALNNFVLDLIYNKYNETLWDVEMLNHMDREELGEQFASGYVKHYANEFEENKDSIEHLSVYAAKEIDRLIPRLYFLEKNHEICEKYSPLLARRIYDVKGKDGFQATEGMQYQFDHDFSDEQRIIKASKASDKQISFLKKLGKDEGYLLWHEDFLSKTYANQMITYLSEKNSEQPTVFTFFFVSK